MRHGVLVASARRGGIDLGFDNVWIDAGRGFNIVFIKVGMAILFGMMFLWFYFRVSRKRLILYLGSCCLLHGVLFAIFFHTEEMSPVGIFLEALVVIAFITVLTAIVGTLLIHFNTKYLAIPEHLYLKPETGNVKWNAMVVVSLAVNLILMLSFSNASRFIAEGVFGGLAVVPFIIEIFLTGYLAYRLLPWKPVEETALLGDETPRKELDNILVFSGGAPMLERITVPAIFCVLWGIIIFITRGRWDIGDWFGIIILAFVAWVVYKRELMREKTILPKLDSMKARARRGKKD